MKIKRSLSGIYFRYQNPVNGKWENWCFEDLPEEKQNELLAGRSLEYLINMVKSLSMTLNNIGEQFDLTTEKE